MFQNLPEEENSMNPVEGCGELWLAGLCLGSSLLCGLLWISVLCFPQILQIIK
ncbi:MAG TPA: hypothetical protein VGB45_00590 [Abditibacterium sp.]|jgi:hypothetical protein